MVLQPKELTRDDTELFLRVYALYQNDRLARAILWYYEFFGDRPIDEIDYDGFLKENPPGTEGYFRWTPIASFFETVGMLVRHGVLDPALVFDRWPVELYWNHLKRFVEEDRRRGQRCDTAWYADNFEWLAQEALVWRDAGFGKTKWQFGPAFESAT